MDAGLAGLIGAVIGGVAAIAGSLIAGLIQLRAERQKWLRSRQDESAKQLNLQIAEVARKMLSAQHSMEWITWHAARAPQSLTNELVSNYQKEIHQTFPELLGALAVTASLNLEAYNQLTPLAEELYRLDEFVSDALLKFAETPVDCAKAVGLGLPTANDLYKRLPLQIADILKSVEGQTAKNHEAA